MRKLNLNELGRLTVAEFKATPKNPLTIVLDNIRSLHNVGSIFRTADAFCLEHIYLCGITSTPPHKEIHKTALGAENSVTWHYSEQTTSALKRLKEEQYIIVGVEQVEGSVAVQDFKPLPGQKYALVFGNEVRGVAQQAIDLCDFCLEIPQFGTKHSFNVSVSAGIVMWEMVRKMTLEV